MCRHSLANITLPFRAVDISGFVLSRDPNQSFTTSAVSLLVEICTWNCRNGSQPLFARFLALEYTSEFVRNNDLTPATLPFGKTYKRSTSFVHLLY